MNFETIAYKYLKNCRIKVSYNFFYQKMVSHPDYPALSALAETLDELGILYNAVIFEEKGNPNITFPFLAHSPQKEGGFEIISSKKHYQKIKSAFLKRWDGMGIMVNPRQVIKNKEHGKILKEEKLYKIYLKIIFSSVCFYLLITSTSISYTTSLFFLLSLAGLFISTTLLLYKKGRENFLSKLFCKTDSFFGCDIVLNSKPNRLADQVTWLDGCIIYFSGTILLFIINNNTKINWIETIPLIFLHTIVAILSAYLVFHQRFFYKVWCKLCMFIFCIVIIQESLIVYFLLSENFYLYPFNISQISTFIFPFFIASFWIFYRILLDKGEDFKTNYIKLFKWKRTPSVFISMLLGNPKIPISIKNNVLKVGAVNAPIQLVLIYTPFCRQCALTHQSLEKLYHKFTEWISFEIIFQVDGKNDDDRRVKAIKHILNAAEKNNSNEYEILHNWFKNMDLNKFISLYPEIKNDWDKDYQVLRDFMKKRLFIQKNSVPKVYLNEYLLPSDYNLDELSLMFSEVKETLTLHNFNLKQYEENINPGWE